MINKNHPVYKTENYKQFMNDMYNGFGKKERLNYSFMEFIC